MQLAVIVALALSLFLIHPIALLFPRAHPTALDTKAYWRLSPERVDFEAAPSQCAALINNPRPYPRKTCARNITTLENNGDFRCADGTPTMFSQYSQDYVLYKYHFRHLKRKGNYLDIATNEPVFISNTYFFDRCLGWAGVCVEGNPRYYEKIHRLRSCALLPTCVSNEDGQQVEFILHSGAGGIDATNKNTRLWAQGGAKEQKIQLRCTTVDHALRRYRVPRVIDYMSLDVEGHELPVLQGINWSSTQINVINIEVSEDTKTPIRQFMASVGYRELDRLPNGQRVGSAIYGEIVFLAPGVVFGKPE